MLAPLLLLSLQARAEDLLVPEFTARVAEDFGLSYLLYQSTIDALRQRGLDVADSEILEARVGPAARDCAITPGCPTNLWPNTDGRLAVAGLLDQQGGGPVLVAYLYTADSPRPMEALRIEIAAGAEAEVGDRIAARCAELVDLLPPRRVAAPIASPLPTPVAPVAAPPPAEQQRPALPEGLVDPFADSDVPAAKTPPPPDAVDEPPPPQSMSPAREQAEMGVPDWTYKRYRASGLSREAWSRGAHLRAGTLGIELSAGGVFGDVDLQYDARVAVEQDGDDLTALDTYQYETMRNSSGAAFGLTVGYAPTWFLEGTLHLGTQLGHSRLNASFERFEAGTQVEQGALLNATAPATLLVIAPGFRLTPIAAGPVKPYGLARLDMRLYPGFSVGEIDGVPIPDRPGGVSVGPTIGAGIAIDAGARWVAFFEAPWTFVQTPQPYTAGGTTLDWTPPQPAGAGQVVVFQAGVGVRI